MSRNGTLLPIPEGSALAKEWTALINAWPDPQWPFRSRWLSTAERVLAFYYPQSSSADRRLTACSVAPFPLRDGHDVP